MEVDSKGLATTTSEITMKVLNEKGRNLLVLKKIRFTPDASKITVLSASSVTDGVETPVDLKTIRNSRAISRGRDFEWQRNHHSFLKH